MFNGNGSGCLPGVAKTAQSFERHTQHCGVLTAGRIETHIDIVDAVTGHYRKGVQ